MIESGTQSGNVLLQRQRSLELSRFYIVQQQFALVAVRYRANECRFSRIADQSDDPRILVLDIPERFTVSRVVQLD